MSYSFPEIKNFRGLYLHANSFAVPDGALEQADNVVVIKEGVLSKIKGSYLYFDPSTKVPVSLFEYRGVLFCVFEDKFSKFADTGTAPNETGSETTLSGETIACVSPRISRKMEAKDNLYFTTDRGVMKIESVTGKIHKAGIPPALDLGGKFIAANGGIDGNNQVGWRVVFGRRDSNNNLLLGAPGDILVLTNPNNTGLAWTRGGGGPYTITVTTTAAHNLAVGQTVTIANGPASMNGDQVVASTPTATSFTFSMVADPGANGTLDYVTTRTARLEFSLPQEISDVADGYFFRIYRTSLSGAATALPLGDFKLIDEQAISSAQITARVISYDDDVPDLFRDAELYTNNSSREGEAQANNRPPLASDICIFKDHAFYFNCTTRHLMSLDVVSSATAFINSGDWIEIKIGSTTRRYIARTGVANDVATGTTTFALAVVTVTYTGHGLLVGDTIRVSNAVGTGTLPNGDYTITAVTANTFDFTAGATPTTLTQLDFQGLADTNGYRLFQLYPPTTPGATVSVGLRETATGLVKAINRDPQSLIYARYISSPSDIPGKMRFEGIGFDGPMQFRSSATLVGDAFSPTLPAAFGSVVSTNDVFPNAVYISKIGEPDAVPFGQFLVAGSRRKNGLRDFALRDSVLLLKEDGVFRVDGDTTRNFQVVPVDTTIEVKSASSAALINNQVIFLANQGVCRATSNAVEIISLDIETPIKGILGKANVSTATVGVSYESDRLYFLTTIGPNDTTATVTYVYNNITGAWSNWSEILKYGVIGPKDSLFFIDSNGKIKKQRRAETRLDYCGQNYAVTINSVSADKLTVNLSTTATPLVGDVIVKSDVINRIAFVAVDGSNYLVTFRRPVNFAASDSLMLYQKYDAVIKFAPFHGGRVGMMKQFAAFTGHLRDDSVTTIEINFGGPSYGSSIPVVWDRDQISSAGGWGLDYWGLFPWGQNDLINERFATEPAPSIRTLVPLFQQRQKYLQPILTHSNAAEAINLQAVTFAVHSYRERVSR